MRIVSARITNTNLTKNVKHSNNVLAFFLQASKSNFLPEVYGPRCLSLCVCAWVRQNRLYTFMYMSACASMYLNELWSEYCYEFLLLVYFIIMILIRWIVPIKIEKRDTDKSKEYWGNFNTVYYYYCCTYIGRSAASLQCFPFHLISLKSFIFLI